jgi:hypothetical protein
MKPTEKERKKYMIKNREFFLSELSALTKKYGIGIHGCGCCGSPKIYDLEYGFGFPNLEFDEDTGLYKVDDEKTSVYVGGSW